MGLIISRAEKESYYLFIGKNLETGNYIRIEKDNVGYFDYDTNRKCSKDFIDAPPQVIILREEIVKREGLENIVKQIKEGNFELNRRNK